MGVLFDPNAPVPGIIPPNLKDLSDQEIDHLAQTIYDGFASEIASLSIDQIRQSLLAARASEEGEYPLEILLQLIIENPKLPPPRDVDLSTLPPTNEWLAPNILVYLFEIFMEIVHIQMAIKRYEREVKVAGMALVVSLAKDIAEFIKSAAFKEAMMHAISAAGLIVPAMYKMRAISTTIRARRNASQQFDAETRAAQTRLDNDKQTLKDLDDRATHRQPQAGVQLDGAPQRPRLPLTPKEQAEHSQLRASVQEQEKMLAKRQHDPVYKQKYVDQKAKEDTGMAMEKGDALQLLGQGVGRLGDAIFTILKSYDDAERVITESQKEIQAKYMDAGFEAFRAATDQIIDALKMVERYSEMRSRAFYSQPG